MRQMARVTMSMRELERLKCIQAVVDGELRPSVAAERLQKSPRQIQRLADRYRREGPVGLLSIPRSSLSVFVGTAYLPPVRQELIDAARGLGR
jgi:hypothetical protein